MSDLNDWIDHFEERAAIREFDGEQESHIAEALAMRETVKAFREAGHTNREGKALIVALADQRQARNQQEGQGNE